MTGAALRIDVLTIFPAMFDGIIGESIIRRAQEKGLVSIRIHDLRAWSADKHKKVDDRPFGGGPGMIMCCQPIFDAIKDLRKGSRSARVIMMSPQGTTLDQKGAARLSRSRHLIMICLLYTSPSPRD